MRVVAKRLRLESGGFRYQAAYLSYLHIKFDDEIAFEFKAWFPISLTSRFGFICSQI